MRSPTAMVLAIVFTLYLLHTGWTWLIQPDTAQSGAILLGLMAFATASSVLLAILRFRAFVQQQKKARLSLD